MGKKRHKPPRARSDGNKHDPQPKAFLRGEQKVPANEHNTEVPNQPKGEAAQNVGPSMFTRIGTWIKKETTFTNSIIALATVIIAIVGYFQWNILDKQLTETATEFSVSHRPWLNVSGPMQTNGPLVFDNTGTHISISYTLKNGGTSPAIGTFTIGPGLIVGPLPSTPQQARQIIDCDKITGTAPAGMPGTIDRASNIIGLLILPGDSYEFKNVSLQARKQAVIIEGAQEAWYPMCIRYKDERGGFHGTGLIWRFSPSDGKLSILPTGSVQGRFEPFPMGSVSY